MGPDNVSRTPARPRLLFVVNVDWFFVSHRLPVALAARDAGFDVHLACAFTGARSRIDALGVTTHELPIARSGTNAAREVRAMLAMIGLMRRLQPDVVHLVTIKPVLLGGIAARIARVPGVVAAISGMGFVFIARGLGARLRRAAVSLLYRAALGGRNVIAIFQNPDDAALVRRMAGLRPDQVVMIRGSGVDLAGHPAAPLSAGEPVVVFAARLLVDKGLREFVAAAATLRAEGVRARFVVAGDPDPHNPASIDDAMLEGWRQEGVVEFVGHRDDLPALFAASHIVVLPSYREGLPKVLVEAAACARAVVTTDVPGCRDAIESGRTGLLVPAMAVAPLAAAMRSLIEDPERCAAFGRAGRELAERHFAIDKVADAHLTVYRRLLERAA